MLRGRTLTLEKDDQHCAQSRRNRQSTEKVADAQEYGLKAKEIYRNAIIHRMVGHLQAKKSQLSKPVRKETTRVLSLQVKTTYRWQQSTWTGQLFELPKGRTLSPSFQKRDKRFRPWKIMSSRHAQRSRVKSLQICVQRQEKVSRLYVCVYMCVRVSRNLCRCCWS